MGIKKRTIKVSQELAAFICDFVFVDYIMALRNKYSFLMPFAQFDFKVFEHCIVGWVGGGDYIVRFIRGTEKFFNHIFPFEDRITLVFKQNVLSNQI